MVFHWRLSDSKFAERIASSVYLCYHAVDLRPTLTTSTSFNSTHKDKWPIFKQNNMYIYI